MSTSPTPSDGTSVEPVSLDEIDREQEPVRKMVLAAMKRAIDGTPKTKKPVRSIRELAEEAGLASQFNLTKRGKANDLWERFQELTAHLDRATTPREIEQANTIAKLTGELKAARARIKKLTRERDEQSAQSGTMAALLGDLDTAFQEKVRRIEAQDKEIDALYSQLGRDRKTDEGAWLSVVRDIQ